MVSISMIKMICLVASVAMWLSVCCVEGGRGRNKKPRQKKVKVPLPALPVFDGVTPYEKVPVYKEGKEMDVPLEKSCLFAHNILRAHHGAKPIKWDKTLANGAQAWANQMANDNRMYHSLDANRVLNGKEVGENIAYKGITLSDTVFQPELFIFNWYKEYLDQKYSFKYPESYSNQPAWHFTQIVWMASTKLGCGEATKKVGNMEKTFFACRYYPAGNYLGAFQNNVHILKKGEQKTSSEKEIALAGCADSSAQCDYARRKGFCKLEFVRVCCCDSCS